LTGGAHVAGDLSAMICRMHHDVCENIHDSARPRLALAVLIWNFRGEPCGRKLAEIFARVPQPFAFFAKAGVVRTSSRTESPSCLSKERKD